MVYEKVIIFVLMGWRKRMGILALALLSGSDQQKIGFRQTLGFER